MYCPLLAANNKYVEHEHERDHSVFVAQPYHALTRGYPGTCYFGCSKDGSRVVSREVYIHKRFLSRRDDDSVLVLVLTSGFVR
mmetsp:Transcript_16774/g.24880  ORF Transcript_16774/g.24880 Transcript_16774/m.24880 type:complete len:83 (+) Transcript_16774:5059-5307(+)